MSVHRRSQEQRATLVRVLAGSDLQGFRTAVNRPSRHGKVPATKQNKQVAAIETYVLGRPDADQWVFD
ncbi:MAG: hypothetical protein JWQ50_2724 [Caballeronia mineralivorans]|jgi:hypothetical protein|nr:hypothetical protein [Caballeronia mineralivorans]MEA3097107.1 hypothetical protein [Caballeronia mineralivorans]